MPSTAPDTESRVLTHVAVAAIVNAGREVLVSLRPDRVHQGGLWEFPGGKVEAGESVSEALERELGEELGIRALQARPLIRIPHHYPDQSVLLDVWRVDGYQGTAYGREGQALKWHAIEDLSAAMFPAANAPIIHALRLPSRYLITPEPGADGALFLQHLDASLAAGASLVQLRAHSLGPESYAALAREAVDLCHRRGAAIVLNSAPQLALALGADGVHLSGARLAQTRQRPLPEGCWVGASCHGREDLCAAQSAGADFAVLSPVRVTASHPGARPLGWETFSRWVDACAIPVYALGGMELSDIETAVRHGAQGIAAIRALWADVR